MQHDRTLKVDKLGTLRGWSDLDEVLPACGGETERVVLFRGNAGQLTRQVVLAAKLGLDLLFGELLGTRLQRTLLGDLRERVRTGDHSADACTGSDRLSGASLLPSYRRSSASEI